MKEKIQPREPNEKIKKIYISGAISGNPNYENDFAEAEKLLSAQGYVVVNPVKIGKHLEVDLGRTPTYEEYMKADFIELLQCDEFFRLENACNSKGSLIEAIIANEAGIPTKGDCIPDIIISSKKLNLINWSNL